MTEVKAGAPARPGIPAFSIHYDPKETLFGIDPGKLATLHRKIGHQPFMSEYKRDDVVVDLGPVDGLALARIEGHDICVGTGFPPLGVLKLFHCGLASRCG